MKSWDWMRSLRTRLLQEKRRKAGGIVELRLNIKNKSVREGKRARRVREPSIVMSILLYKQFAHSILLPPF